jgi:hypothetical protein
MNRMIDNDMEFVFFCGAGDGTQDLALAKQALLLR